MATVTVYGASDDLIEVDGDIRDEFSPHDEDELTYLAFSDGTVVSIIYGSEGVWRIAPVSHGTGTLTIEQAPSDDESNYSDRASLEAESLRWVVVGDNFAKGVRT